MVDEMMTIKIDSSDTDSGDILFRKRRLKSDEDDNHGLNKTTFQWGKAAQRISAKRIFGNFFKSKPKSSTVCTYL